MNFIIFRTMSRTKKLIRFDWAIKKILRNKANFDVLEGFLSVLLNDTIFIQQILDSESNKETEDDKFNRVDILVKDQKGELIIIEIQDSKEYDYFHRILYGTSKAITEHMKSGKHYAHVKKVISITIAYFDLGQGKDYVYHGSTQFKGIHAGDILTLADKQKELYKKQAVYEIYPEYWLLKVEQFNDKVKDKLDEWIYFLKHGEIKEKFTAQGLKAAQSKLDELKLTHKQRAAYNRYLKHLRDKASQHHTYRADWEDELKKATQESLEKGLRQGLQQKEIEAVLGMNEIGLSITQIAQALKISEERVREILQS